MRIAFVVAVVVALIAIVIAVITAKKLRKARTQVGGLIVNNIELSSELANLKEIGWVRGAKGRFERMTPKREIVPGVESELENPVVGN
jgi:hypothetical protein